MSVSVTDVMRHVRNHFVAGWEEADWQLTGGAFSPSRFSPGEWIAIEAGHPLCGVHQLDEHGALPGATDQQWHGRIWRLAPPADFLRLCQDIDAWQSAHPDPAMTSEHFGAYSRTQRPASWQQTFAAALTPYRRMFEEVSGC